MTLKLHVNKSSNMNHRKKMPQGKITLQIPRINKMMTNSMGMKKQGILDISIEALWTWAILAMGMVYSWKNQMPGLTGSFLE